MDFIATCAPGLEGLLRAEFADLGIALPPAGKDSPLGAVRFTGEWMDAARVLLSSRIASRLLLSLRSFSAKTSAMLYDQVRRIDWPRYFKDPEQQRLAVFAHGSGAGLDYALSFAPLKIKDALCDEMRKHGLLRPSVDRKEADVRLEALFGGGRCELSLDLSGAEPLHRRGYRTGPGEAPLRENRAAALLRFAGYDGQGLLVDPFCGTGTILIEAALQARGRAPGLLRPIKSFAAYRLFPEAAEALEQEMNAIRAARRPASRGLILGLDRDKKALREARQNAQKAGVAEQIHFLEGDATQITPAFFEAADPFFQDVWKKEDSALRFITNPPYGERLGTPKQAAETISAFVRQLKHSFGRCELDLILPAEPVLEKSVGLRPSSRLRLENGPIEARFLRFEIYSGSRKNLPADGQAGRPANRHTGKPADGQTGRPSR